jgi:hypothetical protein
MGEGGYPKPLKSIGGEGLERANREFWQKLLQGIRNSDLQK